MSKFQEIDHSGVVKNIEDGMAKVEILQKSSCASCEVNGVCNASESTIKTVDVKLGNEKFEVGEKVNIIFTRNEGFMALFIGYLVPFILMIIVMSILSSMDSSELVVGLSSLAILIPYYLSLFFLKDSIRALFTFRLMKEKN